jgi:hypothetical protein
VPSSLTEVHQMMNQLVPEGLEACVLSVNNEVGVWGNSHEVIYICLKILDSQYDSLSIVCPEISNSVRQFLENLVKETSQ